MTQLKIKCRILDCGNGMFGISFEDEHSHIKTYKYVTHKREELCALVDKINRMDVSPLHIEDIIDDFLE